MSTVATVVAHPTRRILVVSFLLALPLNIIAGATSNHATPAVGLVPLGLSAILAVFFIIKSQLDSSNANKSRYNTTAAVAAFISDVLAIISLLVVLIITWIENRYSYGYGWEHENGRLFLIAYATAPMIINLLIHFYLGLLMLYHALGIRAAVARLYSRAGATCPHCHEDLRHPYAPYFSFARDEYQPVAVREEDRFNDDEAADTLLDPARDSTEEARVAKDKGKEPETA